MLAAAVGAPASADALPAGTLNSRAMMTKTGTYFFTG
jgi:hypothetical protein